MRFSYLWLSDFVKKLPPPEKLAELLTLHSYQVESVEKKGKDFVFDIDILPNRMADSSGHVGIAREISAIAKTPFQLAQTPPSESGDPIAKKLKVELRSKDVSRYVAGMIEDISGRKSPKIIEERLEACGIRAKNSIVDATNYILLETGHPVHAFDYDKIESHTIIVRGAKPGEMMETIDGVSLKLSPEHLVIADTKGPIALAGIKGGKRAEITQKTKSVVFEAALFDRDSVRLTSRKVNIITDASMRFSNGVMGLELDDVMARLLALSQKLSGGRVLSGQIDRGTKPKKLLPVLLRNERVESFLGHRIKEKEIFEILERLGFHVSRKSKDANLVLPPFWRPDIEREEDVIEEVGRVYGYERIMPASPRAHHEHPEENEDHDLADRLRMILKTFGFSEAQNYSFESADNSVSPDRLEVLNPMSRDYQYLRSSLIPGLLKNISENIESKHLRLFEIGKVFRPNDERLMVAGVLRDPGESRGTYFEAKGNLEALFRQLELADVWFEEGGRAALAWPLAGKTFHHPYRSSLIKMDTKTIGTLFQIHPDSFEKAPVIAFEINFDELAKFAKDQLEFRPIPRYPSVVRDISLLVPEDVRVENVMSVIETAGGRLLTDTDLFDYYDENIGEGKKSLAFHLIFRRDDRTLRDEEAKNALGKIAKALEAEGWEIRI